MNATVELFIAVGFCSFHGPAKQMSDRQMTSCCRYVARTRVNCHGRQVSSKELCSATYYEIYTCRYFAISQVTRKVLPKLRHPVLYDVNQANDPLVLNTEVKPTTPRVMTLFAPLKCKKENDTRNPHSKPNFLCSTY